MLENKEDLNAFRALSKVNSKLSHALNLDGELLYLPKAVRYFITAIPIDLERPNTIELKVNPDLYHTVHIILNSNVFYYGGGYMWKWIPSRKERHNEVPITTYRSEISGKIQQKIGCCN